MTEEIRLNKFEKEKRVIELHKQGKTIKEIAKEVHMAFRDISKIIKKYEDSKDEIPSLVELYQICKERGFLDEIKKWVRILHGTSNLEEYRDRLEKEIRECEENRR